MTNVCLLTRDRLKLTEQCLASLYKNTPIKDFCCCVADDGSQDFRVQRLLRRYAEEHSNFLLVEVANSSHVIAQLKNTAIYASEQRFGRGDWLHVGDSDVFFLPGWLEKLTTAAEECEFDGFRLWGGQVHPFHQPVNAIKNIVPGGTLAEHSVLDGPSWLMRWSTWDEVGPMSRECAAGTGQSDDVEWCGRLTEPRKLLRISQQDSGFVDGKWIGRIGVISPPCVVHCGIRNTAGELIPGAQELLARVPMGVIAE